MNINSKVNVSNKSFLSELFKPVCGAELQKKTMRHILLKLHRETSFHMKWYWRLYYLIRFRSSGHLISLIMFNKQSKTRENTINLVVINI